MIHLVVLVLGGIAIWPIMMETYAASESAEERQFALLFAGLLILSCVVTTIIYVLINGTYIKFSEAFLVICIFTAIITGIILWIVSAQYETEEGIGVVGIFLVSLFGAVVPSAVVAFVCRLLRYK